MKQTSYTILALLLFAGAHLAQDAKPTDVSVPPANQPQQQDIRGNLLRELGLSPSQMMQIRRMNQTRKPLMDAAQARLRDATQALDQAIYADQAVENDIQARLKEFQLAQAEVSRIRFMNELAVRRVLTPDQLVRFRELRRRFEAARDDPRNVRRMANPGRQGPGAKRPEF